MREVPGGRAGALFLWDEAAADLSTSHLKADAAYVVLAHGASRPCLRVRCRALQLRCRVQGVALSGAMCLTSMQLQELAGG